MMDVFGLQDKISRSMGLVGQKIGLPTSVYRPAGVSKPVDENRKLITISAAFKPQGPASSSNGAAPAIWHGLFDALYTRQGDYLVSPGGTFFVADQTPGRPVLCVRTNRIVCICRSNLTQQGGYSGFSQAEEGSVLEDWPASIGASSGGMLRDDVETRGFGSWTLLLPILPASLTSTDTVIDDRGTRYSVDTAEQNLLGWRLHVRQTGA